MLKTLMIFIHSLLISVNDTPWTPQKVKTLNIEAQTTAIIKFPKSIICNRVLSRAISSSPIPLCKSLLSVLQTDTTANRLVNQTII